MCEIRVLFCAAVRSGHMSPRSFQKLSPTRAFLFRIHINAGDEDPFEARKYHSSHSVLRSRWSQKLVSDTSAESCILTRTNHVKKLPGKSTAPCIRIMQ